MSKTLHAIRIINKYNTRSNLKKLFRLVKVVSGYSFDIKGSTINDFERTNTNYLWNFYDCFHDIRRISKLLPKLKIQICGIEESEGKEWSYIFKNGKKSKTTEKFIESDYDSDFNESTESNHCSIVSCSSSEYEEEKEEKESDS